MPIDFHTHWIPPGLADALRRRHSAPRIEQAAEGEEFVSWQGRMRLQPLVDLEARCELLDRHQVETQVLSLAGLFGVDCLSVEDALPLVSQFNDQTASACRDYPRRFVGLAALPLADISLASRELVRSHADGLRGAILPADGFVSLRAAERFRPLFETGNRLGCHFFIHPGPLEPQPECNLRLIREDNAWQRRIVLETQAKLSEAMMTLCLSDYLAPYPRVTVQVANLGGTIPFLVERMDAVQRLQGGAPVAPRIRRCYVDTASFGPRSIEMAVACFGVERVLLGTDCPIFDGAGTLNAIGAARLDARTRALVLAGNARRLL